MGTVKHNVDYDGEGYTWDGRHWFSTKTFIEPPVAVVSRLNTLISKELDAEDSGVQDVDELITRAQAARDNHQFDRAVRLLRRVVTKHPRHKVAWAVLSSTLRKQNAPERALEQTEDLKSLNCAAVFVSRAAAMCDLGMWEEAKHEVAIALAIGGANAAAFAVVNRIKASRPDLYEK